MSNDGWDDWDDDEPEDESEQVEEDRPVKKTNSNKGHFTAWEDQVIRDEWATCTDEDIGKRIGRTAEGIARRRKVLGLSKKNGRPRGETRKKSILTNPTEYNLSKLSKDERLEFYKVKFERNPRYGWLLRILLPDELEYYKGKYLSTIESLESITHQEEDLLHNMVMKEIQIMRLQSQIKEQLEDYYDNDDEDKRPPPQYLYQDLDKSEQQYVKYQEKLKLTREQRLKTDREEKITIAGMVRDFQDADNRQRAGDIAGHMAYSTDMCKSEMLKMKFLLGE